MRSHPLLSSHLPLWRLLQDSLSSLCMHPSPPTSTPWPRSMKLVLLGFTCPDQMETTRFPNTFGLSSTDKVRTFSGRYLWLVWFLFTLSVFGFLPLREALFFSQSFTMPATQQACIYSMCVCLHDHVKPQPIDVSLSFLLSQRCTLLLQHPTVCIHFKGGRD